MEKTLKRISVYNPDTGTTQSFELPFSITLPVVRVEDLTTEKRKADLEWYDEWYTSTYPED